jgi:cytochrome P450
MSSTATTATAARVRPPSMNFLRLTGLRRDPPGGFAALARRHGHVVRFTGLYTAYQITHPRDLERVLQTNAQNYVKGRNYKEFRASVGEGLLISDGALWRRQRRLAQPSFQHRRIAEFAAVMARECVRERERWRTLAARAEPFDVAEAMMRLTLRNVGLTMFGTDLTEETDKIGRALDVIRAHAIKRMWAPVKLPITWPTPGNLRFRRALAEGDEVIMRMIEERRRGEVRTDDLLSLLLRARDEETGEGMSDEQLRAEVVTFLTAGHETTAVALGWTWYLLALNPEAEARLHEELARELGGRAPTFEDLPRLRFSTAVVEESMRLYPPVWAMSRTATADDTLGGYHIPKGSEVLIFPYVTQRHPDFWDEPERFDPERFLDPERAAARPRFSYFPFGGGPRGCIGQHFATAEMLLVVATLAQSFRLRLAPGHAVEPQASVTLRPRGGVWMILEERRG